MYNFDTKYAKFLDLCKNFAGNLVNQLGNRPRCGVVPKFSALEAIALDITAEICDIDSEYINNRPIEQIKYALI